MNQERYVTLKEIRDRFGVSRSTVWRWQAEQGLKVMKVGSVIRVRESDLDAFVTRHVHGGRDDAGQGVGKAGGS